METESTNYNNEETEQEIDVYKITKALYESFYLNTELLYALSLIER